MRALSSEIGTDGAFIDALVGMASLGTGRLLARSRSSACCLPARDACNRLTVGAVCYMDVAYTYMQEGSIAMTSLPGNIAAR